MNGGSSVLVTAAVVIRDGRVLVARRKAGSHLGGLWEFPGGKVEPGESPEDCLVRELREELGVSIRVGRILDAIDHRYPEKTVRLLFYACELAAGEPQAIDVAEVRWVPRAELRRLDWVPADAAFIGKLSSGD